MNVFEQSFDFLLQSNPSATNGENYILNSGLASKGEGSAFAALFKNIKLVDESSTVQNQSIPQGLEGADINNLAADSVSKDGNSMPPFLIYQLELAELDKGDLQNFSRTEFWLFDKWKNGDSFISRFGSDESSIDNSELLEDTLLQGKERAAFGISFAGDFNLNTFGNHRSDLKFSLHDISNLNDDVKSFGILNPLHGEKDKATLNNLGLDKTSILSEGKFTTLSHNSKNGFSDVDAIWVGSKKLDMLDEKLSKDFGLFEKGVFDDKTASGLSDSKNIGSNNREMLFFEKIQALNNAEGSLKLLKADWLSARGLLAESSSLKSQIVESSKPDNIFSAATVDTDESASTYLPPSRGIDSVQELKGASSFDLKNGLNIRSQFSPDLSARIQWMMRQSLSSAEILMDPPELGPMTVKVQQHNGELSVIFQVSHPSTKDALEDNMAKLKALLEEQGIALGDTQVQQEDKSGSQMTRNTRDQEQSHRSEEFIDNGLDEEQEQTVYLVRNNKLDVYT